MKHKPLFTESDTFFINAVSGYQKELESRLQVPEDIEPVPFLNFEKYLQYIKRVYTDYHIFKKKNETGPCEQKSLNDRINLL